MATNYPFRDPGMVGGFNHNFRYKGEVYHVQTEDGGLKSPNIVTLLYKEGTILASRRTSYADILKTEHLEQVVEELMKEQHKDMLRSLRNGELDAVLEGRSETVAVPLVASGSISEASTGSEPHRMPVRPLPESKPLSPSATPLQQAASRPAQENSLAETSLDEIILSYLVGEEGNN
jgi:hypothetical protein